MTNLKLRVSRLKISQLHKNYKNTFENIAYGKSDKILQISEILILKKYIKKLKI